MATITAKETVLMFLDALNSEDFEEARKYLEDDMKFTGVMGNRNSADAYIGDMKKMKFKYEIKKTLADDNDVSVFYDINMGKQTIFTSGWYHVKNGKIEWFKVLFDPRPLLEHEKKG